LCPPVIYTDEAAKELLLTSSINDLRAQIKESRFEEPLFDKTLFEMSDEEREIVKQVISLNTKSEVENGRENQKPTVQNEGK
jgi:hypothetical protein